VPAEPSLASTKASSVENAEDNSDAGALPFTEAEIARIDAVFGSAPDRAALQCGRPATP